MRFWWGLSGARDTNSLFCILSVSCNCIVSFIFMARWWMFDLLRAMLGQIVCSECFKRSQLLPHVLCEGMEFSAQVFCDGCRMCEGIRPPSAARPLKKRMRSGLTHLRTLRVFQAFSIFALHIPQKRNGSPQAGHARRYSCIVFFFSFHANPGVFCELYSIRLALRS